MSLDLTALRNSIPSLEAGFEIVAHATRFDRRSEHVKNVRLAGVVQNFEVVYEISVEMIRRQLEAEAASPEEVDESSFRDVTRAAAERGLIPDAGARDRKSVV